ncbi:MAG: hypothetical protein BM558_08625 [Roseobacter sp. MedPE-SW]|nr:MAG: hypothetical protein BM558_08625 [Roseobacter sp. MedPE-SW]
MSVPRHLALVLCAATLPLAANAGAWKQPVDTGFSSTSFSLRRTDQGLVSEFGYYRDFGISTGFDLGIDLNHQQSHPTRQSGHMMLFARLPLYQDTNTRKIAAEFALGGNHANLQWHPMYRFTLSIGNSKATNAGHLWGNLDLIYEQRGDTPHPQWKLNGNLGLDGNRRVSPLLQVETSFGPETDFNYAIIPSLRINLSELFRAGKPHFENSDLTIGLEYRHENTQSFGVKIALWQRF